MAAYKTHSSDSFFVGQPILAAAAFQAAFSELRASLAEGIVGGFSTRRLNQSLRCQPGYARPIHG
jgi:hypothetical protein